MSTGYSISIRALDEASAQIKRINQALKDLEKADNSASDAHSNRLRQTKSLTDHLHTGAIEFGKIARSEMEKLTKEFTKVSGGIGNTVGELGKAFGLRGLGVAAGIAGAGLAAYELNKQLMETARTSRELGNLSARTGVDPAQIQKITAVNKLLGVSAEQTADEIRAMSEALREAYKNGGPIASFLAEHGVSLKEDPAKALIRVKEILSEMAPGQKRTEVAQAFHIPEEELSGLYRFKDALKEVNKSFHDISAGTLKTFDDLKASSDRLEGAWESLKNTFIDVFGPGPAAALKTIKDYITDIAQGVQGLLEKFNTKTLHEWANDLDTAITGKEHPKVFTAPIPPAPVAGAAGAAGAANAAGGGGAGGAASNPPGATGTAGNGAPGNWNTKFGQAGSSAPNDARNNWGSIAMGPFAAAHGGQQSGSSRWAAFPTPEAGVVAVRDLLSSKYGGLSIKDMVAKYAPPGENNTGLLTQRMSGWMGMPADQVPNMKDPETMRRLVTSFIANEHGGALPKGLSQDSINKALGFGAGAPGGTGANGGANLTDAMENLNIVGKTFHNDCARIINVAARSAGLPPITDAQGNASNIATNAARWGQGVGGKDIKRGDLAVHMNGRGIGQTGGHVAAVEKVYYDPQGNPVAIDELGTNRSTPGGGYEGRGGIRHRSITGDDMFRRASPVMKEGTKNKAAAVDKQAADSHHSVEVAFNNLPQGARVNLHEAKGASALNIKTSYAMGTV